MGQLSLWEREYRMLGQDVFHAKKLIRDSGGKNEVAERRIVTLREKQVELLLTKVKELERQMEKGEQGMNIQKIQLEIGLSTDAKAFFRELFGGQSAERETNSDKASKEPEETIKGRLFLYDLLKTKKNETMATEKEETKEISTTEYQGEESLEPIDEPEEESQSKEEGVPKVKDSKENENEENKEPEIKTEESEGEKEDSKEEVSVDELRSVALAVVTTPEKEVAIQVLLKEFGAMKLSDVPAERREEFLLRLKAL